MKKLLKIISPILVLVVSIGIVQGLSAAKPEPEKKEEAQRLVSLYVDEVKSDTVTISVQTQGEVRPKTEIDLIPQVSGRIVGISDAFAEGAEEDIAQITHKVMLVLAVATSIDAMAAGFSLTLMAVDPFLSCAIIGLTTFLFSWVGVYVGAKSGVWLESKAALLGGITLILIGFKILIF